MTVAIPEGVLDSETVKLMIGDQFIFVTFEVMPDSIFSRDEFDVMQTVKVPLSKRMYLYSAIRRYFCVASSAGRPDQGSRNAGRYVYAFDGS